MGGGRMGGGRMGGGRMGGGGGGKRISPPKDVQSKPVDGFAKKDVNTIEDKKVKPEDGAKPEVGIKKPEYVKKDDDDDDDDVKFIGNGGDVARAENDDESKKEGTKYESHSLNERQSVDPSSSSSANGAVRRSRRMGAVVCPDSDPGGSNKELRKLGEMRMTSTLVLL